MSYDLFVIGGGPGGYAAAIRAAQLGLKTVLAERDAVGGACLNRGCIPTKTLLQSARLYREMCRCADFGLRAEGVGFDYAALHARKEQVVDRLRRGVEDLLRGNRVERLKGSARIEAPGRVRVGEEVYGAQNILIATGARPALPPVPGLDAPGVVTSDRLLDEGRFYPRLMIVGGGVIGMEFAELYCSLGAEVTVLEARERILPDLDREISQNLSMLLRRRGVTIQTGASLSQVEPDGGALSCAYAAKGGAGRATADAVLVATGRRPNTEGLCAPGVDLGIGREGIPVDGRFETRLPGIYAVGDVVRGNRQLAHAATAQGINVVSALAGKTPPMLLEAIPACVYTEPEIATVGWTEAECKGRGLPVKSAKYPMSGNGRSVIADADRGFIKVAYDPGSGKILGAQLMCEGATELVGAFTAAVAQGRTLEEMASLVRAHPTFGEGISEAVETGLGRSIHQLNR